MKGRIAISVSAIIFSMLISGCASVKPNFSNANITGFNNSYNMGHMRPGNYSYEPSSERLSSSDNSLINMKKDSLKLSISFPPSARLEF